MNKKKIISAVIMCILFGTLIFFMKKNNLEFRTSFSIVIIIILLSVFFILLWIRKRKNIYFIALFILILASINTYKHINEIEEVCFLNNVKLVKVKKYKNCTFDYHKYINEFLMSKNVLVADYYPRVNFYANNLDYSQMNRYYYNDILEKNKDKEINIVNRESHDLIEKMDTRIVKIITNSEELSKFNGDNYVIAEIKNVDFSKYNILAISYNLEEIIPYYIGILNNDINLVIKNEKENEYSKVLILEIEKEDVENIKISDFNKYINPI